VGNANTLVIQRFFNEILNDGNLSVLEKPIARDFIDHTPGPGQAAGRAGVQAKIEGLRRAFPDIRFVLEDAVAEGDTLAVRYYWTGTQTGPFLDMAPTGKPVRVRGMDFYRFRNGAVAEHWEILDQLGLLRHLGRA
jgi:predicted ester cyclase